MISKTKLYDLQNKFFDTFIYLSYILTFISALGISEFSQTYLDNLSYYTRVYICLFLIWRFNPLREKYEFTDLDRKIAFSAGLFILTTTALNDYAVSFKNSIKNIFT
jgi:hypothetical protein